MATGGSSEGSDLIHDFSCSKCEEAEHNTEAQHFCPQCEYYLCDNCVNKHNAFHNNHTVYGRGEIQKWSGFYIDKCDQHGNKLEVHCNDHQELCCSVCVALNHRLCGSISHLPDLARGFLKSAEFKQLLVEVYDMWCWLDGLKSARMKDQASLKDSYKNIIAEIRAIRREINNILDQVEKKTVNELDSLMNNFEKSVRDDLNTCAEMHDRLKTMHDKLQHVTGSQKETNSYIGFRKCQTKLNEARSLGQEIQRRPEEKFSFKSDKSVLPFLRNLNSLGNCYSVNSMPNKTDTVHVYKAQTSGSYSVNINKDKRVCRIVGIYELPSGEVIIADLNNERVKLLDRQFNVTDHYDLPARPQHLCHIAGEEIAVAVSVQDLGDVQFLTVSRGHIQAGRKFTLDHKCNSIAHFQGQLYVVSSYSLYQYNMDGQMIRKMYDISPCNLPGQRCAVSSDGEIIYVINNAKHELVTLNKGGQVLSTLRDPVLQQPSGLCVSPSGHVFVCGQESDTVLQVDREGRQKLATIARKANGLSSPWSVCFSEQTSSLIVGSFFSDKIIVVTLC